MSLCRPLEDIPSSISQLQQLQQLNLFRTKVQQLPEELGTWLPQLRVLEARRTEFPTIPHSLSRLTCLVADDSCVTELSAVEHLVALKCLHLESISPPLQALSRLVALETLCLGLWCRLSEQEAAAVCIPGPLPNLRSLTVEAETGIPAGGLQVLVGAEQLTHLRVEVHAESGQENDQLAALWETGVLPQLQQLVIMCDGGEYPPVLQAAAAIPWLEQQPQLTSLRISGCLLKALELEQLPCQLEALDFRCCKLADDDPGVLTHLTRLHTLKLPVAGEVPQWLEYLKRLEELHVWTRWFVDGVQLTGWEVLAQLPLLRRGKGLQEAFPYAPHLCWSAECYSDSDED
jgi:Leucine-rich repeat (LRR) protein